MIQSSPFFSARVRRPCDVGAAGRFGEQLAPDFLAGGERRQIFALLLLAGERHHGRPAHAVADDEHRRELAERAFLLLPDHALDRRSAAAAIFLWPVQAGPPRFGLCLLPGLGDLENVDAFKARAAERGFAQLVLILLRRIGRDPGFRLAAERGFLRGVVEVHRFILSCVPRMLRSTKWCAADPGSIMGPGSAKHHCALHRVRDTSVSTPRSSCACGRSARLPNTTGCRARARAHWRGGSTCGSRTPR